jgi:multicomponent Na+:H+ antiporter subunit D
MMLDHVAVLSIVGFFGGALLVALFARVAGWMSYAIAVGTTAGVLLLNIAGLGRVLASGPIRYAIGGWKPPIGIELVHDALSAFFVLLMSGVGLIVLVHSRLTVAREVEGRGMAYYSSAMLLLGAFAGIVLTGDLFNLYVFLEISALAGYALLGVGSGQAAVATFRYLILGTVGASFYLLGVGFIFLGTGTLNMSDLKLILDATGLEPLIVLGLVFIVAGVAMKMALFPMHLWLPDVYSAAVSSSTALIAPLGTKIAAYILIRILLYVMDPAAVQLEVPFGAILAALGAGGIIWGSVMAVAQRDLRRMLAYSSVAQIGYIALGIGLGNAAGFIGAILHALNHACMKSCLFMVCGNLRAAQRGLQLDQLDHSLRRTMPWTSLSFTIAALSMIGLPPTAGFFSKWYLLLGSVENRSWIYVAVIIISSLLNAVYFFRVIERMYLPRADAPAPEVAAGGDSRPTLVAPVVLLGVGLLVLGFGNVAIVRTLIQPMLPAGF